MGDLAMVAQQMTDAVMAANAQLDSRFCAAMSRKDVQGAMACFLDSPDLALVLYGKVLWGPAALRQFLAELFSSMKTVQLDINEVTHWVRGDTVFAAGTATYEFEALDGAKSVLKERWTDARQNVGGRWVYILDHATEISEERAPARQETKILSSSSGRRRMPK